MSGRSNTCLPTPLATFESVVWTEASTLVTQCTHSRRCTTISQETSLSVAAVSQKALGGSLGSARSRKTEAKAVHFSGRSEIAFPRKCVFCRICDGPQYLKSFLATKVTAKGPRSVCIKRFVQFQSSKKSTL